MPYGLIFDVIVVLVLIAAIVKAGEEKARIGLGVVLAVVIGLPHLVAMRPLGGLWWIHTIFKVLAGLASIVYLKLPE
jgi:hypothetical protein